MPGLEEEEEDVRVPLGVAAERQGDVPPVVPVQLVMVAARLFVLAAPEEPADGTGRKRGLK